MGGVIALLVALLFYAYATPEKLKPLPILGPSAFDGTNLKLSGGYSGIAMVAFTSKTCESANGDECKRLNGVLKRTQRKTLLERAALKAGLLVEELRIAKVYCESHDDLCVRFAVTGDDADAAGFPALIMFRNGTHYGPFAGPRTPDSIKESAKVALATSGSDE